MSIEPSIGPPPKRSGENRREPLLARPSKWIAERQPLIEIRIRRIASLQKNPLNVDELAVLPHSDPDLSLHIELVLGCERETSHGVQCTVVKLARHWQDEKSASRPLRRHSVRQLEPVGAHRFQRQAQLQLESAQLVPPQKRELGKNIVAVGVGVLSLLRGDHAREGVQHKGELASGRPPTGKRRPLESGIGWRRKIFQQVLSDQRRLAYGGRWRIPIETNVAPEAEVVEQLRGSDEVVADLEVVGVPQD